MLKLILKTLGLIADTFFTVTLASYALSLSDKGSDNAVLGAIGILLIVVLVNTFVIRAVFGR